MQTPTCVLTPIAVPRWDVSMNRLKSRGIGRGVGLLLCGNPLAAPAATPHGLAIEHGQLLLDAKPFRIIAGDMHYTRVPREYWRARLKMAKAMGLNTITTYVFWNAHEKT